jgi:transposase
LDRRAPGPWAHPAERSPPSPIQALHDLTRTRVTLIQTQSPAKNRVHKVIEDTNMKLASVVADLFGVSGRRTLAALMA